jgi:hypothetical protein
MRRRPLFTPPPGFQDEPVPGLPPNVRVLMRHPGVGPAAGRRYTGLGGPSARRGGGGHGDNFPDPLGTPGNPVWPYGEQSKIWGETETVGAPLDPSVRVAPPSPGGAAGTGDGHTAPFGRSDTQWKNPTTFQTVPILSTTPTATPVLSLNLQRNAVLVQNGSTATAPDTAPILYIGFNAQPIIGFSLAVYPNGGAILLDIISPRDSIYVAFGPFVNGGATAVLRGSITQGTFTGG